GRRVLRVDVVSATARRADDVMFILARRMEALGEEESWPILPWARLDTWSYVTTELDPHTGAIPMSVRVDDVDLEITCTPFSGRQEEAAAEFTRRVSEKTQRPQSAQGI